MPPISAREHQFWLQIMEEHGLFIYDHLSPRETDSVRAAEQFVLAYQALRRRVPADGVPGSDFAREAQELNGRFRNFKLSMMRNRMENRVVLNLTPAFFNGIISELEEYMRLLAPVIQGGQPPAQNVFHHLMLWLPDQIGHASLLVKDLDLVEREITRQATEFASAFTDSYLKTISLIGLNRAYQEPFPELNELVADVAGRVKGFYEVVGKAVEMYRSERLLSRATITFLEHHFPESDYFLFKLAESAPAVAAANPQLFLPPAAK